MRCFFVNNKSPEKEKYLSNGRVILRPENGVRLP